MGSLEQDYVTVPGQNFALISLVGPDCPQKNEKFGLKIRGCFATKEEAASHAKRLQKDDTLVDIYVVDMYKWLLIPPDNDHIEDTHYQDEKLEEIMSKYKENQRDAARMFEKRKKDMMAIREEGDMPFIEAGDENSKFYTRPDEPPVSHPSDHIDRLKEENPDKEMEEIVKMADEIVKKEMEDRAAWRKEQDEKAAEAEASAEASSSNTEE